MATTVVHKSSFPVALRVALGVAALVLAAMVGGRFATHESFGYFTRDPAQVTDSHEYLGFVSFFGVFGWCIGATSLGFAAFVAHLRGDRRASRALAVGAAAVAYLMVDDALLLHDGLYERLGISDKVTEPIYVIVVAVLLARGRWFVRRTSWPVLALAGGLFAVSVLSDLATDNLRYVVIEDSFKFLAIAVLAAYCAMTAAAETRALSDSRVAFHGASD